MPHISAKPGLVRGTGLAGMGQQQPRYTKAPGFVRPDEPDPMWRERAACRDTDDLELWFPIGNTGPALLQIEDAKFVCDNFCPVRDHCGAWALDAGIEHGVWGGMSEDDRRREKRREARQRSKAKA